jgi:hypothetical protein
MQRTISQLPRQTMLDGGTSAKLVICCHSEELKVDKFNTSRLQFDTLLSESKERK